MELLRGRKPLKHLCNDMARSQYLGFRAGQAAARDFGTSLICLFAREVVMCGQDERMFLSKGSVSIHVHAELSQQPLLGKGMP